MPKLSEIIDEEIEKDERFTSMSKAEKLLTKTFIKKMLAGNDDEVPPEQEENVRAQLRFALANVEGNIG